MTEQITAKRVERDSIGAFDVPLDAVYGIKTQRAIQLYPMVGQGRFADYPALLDAMLQSCVLPYRIIR
ncbi:MULTISPECIES: hypothetical protein [unclassified Rhizobium]|uniref:hypothetical protein n=1 Tax=unclassified Rhizobium TaxID=2613769 RepID=UPI000BD51AFE|nr:MULTISPECIES: hypothetical protein [unclassified Rhizobium]MDH7810063.1 aspartate ammonia-lyase [Rhizobium sp. AN67]MDQ4408650.1 hypothetical protein [Rhizobium sp. AN63]SOD50209.1 aspartate ammonia-lyase [Rhizobium sp. AN6A]